MHNRCLITQGNISCSLGSLPCDSLVCKIGDCPTFRAKQAQFHVGVANGWGDICRGACLGVFHVMLGLEEDRGEALGLASWVTSPPLVCDSNLQKSIELSSPPSYLLQIAL